MQAFVSAAHQNLQRLCWIRGIALIALIPLLFSAIKWLNLTLPLEHFSLIFLIFLFTTILAFIRSKQKSMITDWELAFHLLIDIGLLSTLLYFIGGATNPFVSYFLIPVTISAATLPWMFTLSFAAITIISYSTLLIYYIPVGSPHHHPNHQSIFFNWHILGMWFNFVLSVGLITFFIVKMSTTIRLQRKEQQKQRENQLINEQVLAIASLAAGTAHELRTPLSTLKNFSE